MSHATAQPKMQNTTSKEPWTVEVDVHLKSDDDPNNPLFTIGSVIKKGSGADGKLVFNNNGRPGFKLLFEFHDDTRKGYTFPAREQDAVWSQLGANACPRSQVWDVFEPVKVFADGKKLTVRNPNPSPAQGEFTYSLRVTKDNGKTFLLLDPGGVNENGNVH